MLLRLTCLLLLSLCLPLAALAEDAALNQVRPGLYAGGQPSAAQLRELAAKGVRTVIDLRQPGEDRGTCCAEGCGGCPRTSTRTPTSKGPHHFGCSAGRFRESLPRAAKSTPQASGTSTPGA